MARILASLAALALVVAVAAADAAAPASRVLQTRGVITHLAADGSRVAATIARTGGCDGLVVWRPAVRQVTRFQPRTNCPGSETSGGQGIIGLALAGTRVAWLETFAGNLRENLLQTATVARRKPVTAEFASHDNCGGVLEPGCGGEHVGFLAGRGSLIAYNRWHSCTGEEGLTWECKNGVRPGVDRAELRRLDGSRPRVLRVALPTMDVAAVDAGRIAVARTSGQVALYRSDGTPLVAIAPAGPVRAVALQGQDLVVQRGAETAVYDATLGTLAHTWPLSGTGARLRDADGGVAVYTSGSTVHLIRLSDGRDATAAAPGRTIVDAQLEPSGLFYAYNVSGRNKGRVAFTPRAALPRVQ